MKHSTAERIRRGLMCVRCNRAFTANGKRRKKRWSTGPKLFAAIAYYQTKYNLKYPHPSAFCGRCQVVLNKVFAGNEPNQISHGRNCYFEQTSGEKFEGESEFAEVGKFEEEGGFQELLSTHDLPAQPEEKPFQCILCNRGALQAGFPQNIPKPSSEDLVVMFVLQKMLEIPGNKLQECIPKIGPPKSWISSCVKCKALILQAFHTQEAIHKLERQLRTYQTLFMEKVKMSWNDSEIYKSEKKQPVSTQSRCYVTREEWPEFDLSMEVDVPVYNECSPQPSPSTSIKNEILSSPEDNDCDFDYDPNEESESSLVTEARNPIIKKKKSNRKRKLKNEILSSPEDNDCDFDYNPNEVLESSLVTEARNLIIKKKKSNSKRKLHCQMCPDKEFMHLQAFLQHILYHKRRPFKCKVCGNFFTGDTLEFKHFPKPTPTATNQEDPPLGHTCSPETLEKIEFKLDPIWKCRICPETFDLEADRDSHFQKSHYQVTFESSIVHSCRDCPKQYSEFEDWLIHRSLEHPHIAEVSCYYCDERFEIPTTSGVSFPENKSRTDHIRISHKKQHKHVVLPVPECEFCGDQFQAAKFLYDHVQGRHSVPVTKTKSCPYCFMRKSNMAAVKNHVLLKHNPTRERFVCDECGYSSIEDIDLREHKLAKHGVVTSNKNLQKCTQDGCSFHTYLRPRMKTHMVANHGMPNPWICKVCGKAFFQKQKLSNHEQIHKNKLKKPFQCEICGNSFAVKNYLYIHMRLSHQNRPFVSTHKKKPPRQRKTKQTGIVQESGTVKEIGTVKQIGAVKETATVEENETTTGAQRILKSDPV